MNFSELVPNHTDPQNKKRLANQILSILHFHYRNRSFRDLSILDIGCSSGVLTNFLAPNFKEIIGIDIDQQALPKSPHFRYMAADDLKFKDQSFDVVIYNQVYYWLPDAAKMFSEIYRILKPGGVCYFAAVNKYTLFEPQYRKPFISFLPKFLAHFIEPRYACHYLSYWELLKITHQFKVHHFTPLIFKTPHQFLFTRLYKYSWLLQHLSSNIFDLIEPISPNLIWLLEKPAKLS